MKNKTFVTTLDEWDKTGVYREAIGRLEANYPNSYIPTDVDFIVPAIQSGPLDLHEFEIEAVFLSPPEHKIEPYSKFYGQLSKRKHRVHYARAYESPMGSFNLIVPEEEMLYIIRDSDKGIVVQWCFHDKTEKAKEIIDDIRYTIWRKSPLVPLSTIVKGNDLLSMGTVLSISEGTYKKLS